LKRLFGATGRDGWSGGAGSSDGDGSPGETAVTMITCDEASARLFEFLDGELDDILEEEVRRHLEVCKACCPRAQFEKHFLEALRRSRNDGQASSILKKWVLQALAEDEGPD
jgi:anti-sigma factor (TIGR02949 family)